MAKQAYTAEAIEVLRGIYTDTEGGMFEVVTTALNGEDFEPLVVYRELFGDYQFLIASPQNFTSREATNDIKPRFELVKAL